MTWLVLKISTAWIDISLILGLLMVRLAYCGPSSSSASGDAAHYSEQSEQHRQAHCNREPRE